MTRRRSESPADYQLTLVSGDICRDGVRVPGTVVIQGQTIVEVAIGSQIVDATARQYEVSGGLIIPGLIDLHVHGGGGHSVYRGQAELRSAGAWLAARGVTGFLASVPALPWAEMMRACAVLARACAAGDPPNLLGIHLEGPHLSSRQAGSQSIANLRSPSLIDYQALHAAGGQAIKLMTIAPELPGASEVIQACRRDGIVSALGHSDASYEEALMGFASGISHVSHLYNALKPFHHRAPGAIAAALTHPSVTAELILDGEHVRRGAWELARTAIGLDRICLVSDALPAAGLTAPESEWADSRITRRGRRWTLEDGTLAGSDISLLQAVVQACTWELPWPQALAAATAVPARVLGLGSSTGHLLPGFRGDLCVIGRDHQVALTLVGGRPWPVDPAAV